MSKDEKKAKDTGAGLAAGSAELEELSKLSDRTRRMRIREELKKVASDKPENIARVIKAWLQDKD